MLDMTMVGTLVARKVEWLEEQWVVEKEHCLVDSTVVWSVEMLVEKLVV
jgi:hypothetical protein